MDIEKERRDLDSRVGEKLENDMPNEWYYPSGVIGTGEKDEYYFHSLKAFKYLYSLGGEAHTYLWNDLWFKCQSDTLYDESDFTESEIAFIRSIAETYSEFASKYGENYSSHTNINAKIETPRLTLSPYDDALDKKYRNYFSDNQLEYEKYYSSEYDNFTFSLYGSQIRPLSFAILSKDTNEFIGSVALNMKRSECVYNIEYYILPEFRRRGYAAEAVSTLIDAARKKELNILQETIREGVYEEVPADIKCIEAKIHTDNTASIELVKKLGFELMGKELYHQKLRDTYFDAEVYDLMI